VSVVLEVAFISNVFFLPQFFVLRPCRAGNGRSLAVPQLSPGAADFLIFGTVARGLSTGDV